MSADIRYWLFLLEAPLAILAELDKPEGYFKPEQVHHAKERLEKVKELMEEGL